MSAYVISEGEPFECCVTPKLWGVRIVLKYGVVSIEGAEASEPLTEKHVDYILPTESILHSASPQKRGETSATVVLLT